jgi:hypothetical protein
MEQKGRLSGFLEEKHAMEEEWMRNRALLYYLPRDPLLQAASIPLPRSNGKSYTVEQRPISQSNDADTKAALLVVQVIIISAGIIWF